MEKRDVYVTIILIVIIIIAIGAYNSTGFNILYGGELKGCYDTDNGTDIYVKGIVSYENRLYSYTDHCVREAKVLEYFCKPGTPSKLDSKKFGCSNGCKDGACVK